MKPSYSLNSRIWISSNENETFLGQGRIDLLKEIKTHGSISKAAKAMNMSYKKAWALVDSMNRLGPEPIVVSKNGGKKGGGSEVSQYGDKLILAFDELIEEHRSFLSYKMKELAL